jgi:L-seryl-tRNA(Ser) seleniumtransferase
MFMALERYVNVNHDAEWKDWEARLDVIEKAVASVPGVRTSRFVPEIANHVPHLSLQWDETAFGLTQAGCARQLEEGEPSIICLAEEHSQGLSVTPFMLQPGEERIVARRLKEILSAAQKKART